MPALDDFRFCPRCATPLEDRVLEGRGRRACPKDGCGFIAYGNPTPVVAAIVQRGDAVLLVRAKGWPEKMFGLVTGFLEAGEAPRDAVLREVREELGLSGTLGALVGVYAFELRNELIACWHVTVEGEPTLGDELEACKAVPVAKLRPWPFGTGQAVADWLETVVRRPSGT